MARYAKKNKKEIGLAPDDLFFRGEKKMKHTQITVIDYDATTNKEVKLKKSNEISSYLDTNTVSWVNIDGLHNEKLMANISDLFHLDSLIIADVMDIYSRPKISDYNNCIALSIKMLKYNEVKDEIDVENLSLVLTKGVLISFQEKSGDVFDPVRERIRNQKKRIRNLGADYLMYALLDIVVDNYLYLISILADKIEALEDKLLENPDSILVQEINALKKELNFIRKSVLPAKDMIIGLYKLESDLIETSNEVFFKELVNNVSHAIEVSDGYREILSDHLNIYHTTISGKLNDIMKFLTVFSVVFIPLTFIAGIYGTNFDFVPELQYKYSYFIMWAVMIILAMAMLYYFKRKKWL